MHQGPRPGCGACTRYPGARFRSRRAQAKGAERGVQHLERHVTALLCPARIQRAPCPVHHAHPAHAKRAQPDSLRPLPRRRAARLGARARQDPVPLLIELAPGQQALLEQRGDLLELLGDAGHDTSTARR